MYFYVAGEIAIHINFGALRSVNFRTHDEDLRTGEGFYLFSNIVS